MRIGKIASVALLGFLVLSSAFIFAPAVSAAEPISKIIPCSGTDCNLCSFVNGMNNVIKYLIYTLALPIGAITLAFAGFKYAFAQGNTGVIKEAYEMFRKSIFGLVIALSAWLFVNFIFQQLVSAEYNAPWSSINCSGGGTSVIK